MKEISSIIDRILERDYVKFFLSIILSGILYIILPNNKLKELNAYFYMFFLFSLSMITFIGFSKIIDLVLIQKDKRHKEKIAEEENEKNWMRFIKINNNLSDSERDFIYAQLLNNNEIVMLHNTLPYDSLLQEYILTNNSYSFHQKAKLSDEAYNNFINCILIYGKISDFDDEEQIKKIKAKILSDKSKNKGN